jgi:hypothetical protein
MTTEFIPKEQAAMEFIELTGEERKDAGMQKAAENHKTELESVQAIARDLARIVEIISIDDVRQLIPDEHWGLGNAAGSVFKGDEWEWCGFAKSKRPAAHSRMVRTWRLK